MGEAVLDTVASTLDASPDVPGSNQTEPSLYELLPELKRLDRLLAQAGADPFRGLHVGRHDVDHLLGRAPGVPVYVYQPDAEETQATEVAAISETLAWLVRTYGLTSFDVDVILLALAPELDQRYERLYAYLQDDVTRRPAVSGKREH